MLDITTASLSASPPVRARIIGCKTAKPKTITRFTVKKTRVRPRRLGRANRYLMPSADSASTGPNTLARLDAAASTPLARWY